MAICHLVYEVIALMLHRGNTVHVGHYVCIWKKGPHLWLCDDAHVARACTESDLQHLSSEVYITWYKRRQASPLAGDIVI